MNSNQMKKRQKPETKFRMDLDICSRNKDLSAAISLYEFAVSNPTTIHLNHYHFNSLLYICSNSISCSDSTAIDYGSRIFNHMLSANVIPNEATITSASRIAAAKGDADLAFDLVKEMKKYGAGVIPKLRSYGPALFCFCKNLDANKAYLVEEDMLANGLVPKEPELMALLKLSVECGRSDKVYEYLHKLRRVVGRVSEDIVGILDKWFAGGNVVGLENWDRGSVKDAILRNGGGWHGLGWLGNGKWDARRTKVSSCGVCCCCDEGLVCVDIGKEETENFGDSVASLAMKKEVEANFRDFQIWLDQHSEYEAIVDAANIGLYQQNFVQGGFSMMQLVAVVNELYNRNKKWPLIVLHKKRIKSLYENACNRVLLDEWTQKGVLYGTPYGSNDDWYWLYAAVKLKCFLVTNDEMRDHIFELIGSDFFVKWKERHQIRYTFVKGVVELHMPPPYSVVIQESENGAWHVPLAGECNDESSRTWLCISRTIERKASDEDTKCLESSEITKEYESFNSCQPCNGTSLSNGLKGHSDDSCSNTAVTGKRKERSPSPPRTNE